MRRQFSTGRRAEPARTPKRDARLGRRHPRGSAALWPLPPAAAAIERLVGGQGLPEHLAGGVVALGNFDGVHLGHQAVVARAVSMARGIGVPAIVGTFDPHPRSLFQPDLKPFRLTSLDQRGRLLARLGVDALMVFPFDRPLASIEPEEFVTRCLGGAGGVVTGADFAFGHKRSGNVARLAALGAERGITIAAVGDVVAGRGNVSSTRIRQALLDGDCAEAGRLLTRPFAIEGRLQTGLRRDPALPILDAAIGLGKYLRPRPGVYAVRATLADGRRLGGSAFFMPSSDKDDVLELFLVDLTPRDLGRGVSVELVAYLHEAPAVHARTALRQVIQNDRNNAFDVIARIRP